jgi:hypothetical protein
MPLSSETLPPVVIDSPVGSELPSWRIRGASPGLLRVHAEVDQVDEDLHVALRLRRAAMTPKERKGLAVLRHEGGDDRVERALAGA